MPKLKQSIAILLSRWFLYKYKLQLLAYAADPRRDQSRISGCRRHTAQLSKTDSAVAAERSGRTWEGARSFAGTSGRTRTRAFVLWLLSPAAALPLLKSLLRRSQMLNLWDSHCGAESRGCVRAYPELIAEEHRAFCLLCLKMRLP